MSDDKKSPPEDNRPDRCLKEAAAVTANMRQLTSRVSNTAAETAKMFGRRRSVRPNADMDLIWPE